MNNKAIKKSSNLRGFLFVITFLIRATIWDLRLRLLNFINRKKTYKYYKRHMQVACRKICEILSFFTGLIIDLDIPKNINLPENFIIISNHQSLVDIPIIINSLLNHNIRFVAKKSLKYKIPSISLYLRIGKHAFVGRHDNFKETINEMEKISVLTKTDKVCPCIFPEGTRSKDGNLGEFHSAALKLICRFRYSFV